MTPEVDCAQISPTRSYRHRRLDRRVRVVVHDRDVVVGVVEDRITRRQNEFRIRPRIAAELQR